MDAMDRKRLKRLLFRQVKRNENLGQVISVLDDVVREAEREGYIDPDYAAELNEWLVWGSPSLPINPEDV